VIESEQRQQDLTPRWDSYMGLLYGTPIWDSNVELPAVAHTWDSYFHCIYDPFQDSYIASHRVCLRLLLDSSLGLMCTRREYDISI